MAGQVPPNISEDNHSKPSIPKKKTCLQQCWVAEWLSCVKGTNRHLTGYGNSQQAFGNITLAMALAISVRHWHLAFCASDFHRLLSFVNMKDCKGIQRGKCSVCPCREFVASKTGHACNDCGHSPLNHVAVNVTVSSAFAAYHFHITYNNNF